MKTVTGNITTPDVTVAEDGSRGVVFDWTLTPERLSFTLEETGTLRVNECNCFQSPTEIGTRKLC